MEIVNMEEAKKEFIKFTENYDLTIDSIKRKQDHSLRVMELSEKIAINEKFTNEEIQIASLIGLLHDIARFKQYTEYKTFSDSKSFDHGEMGVEILENVDYLRKFIKLDKYDKTIKIAIRNHNKIAIEEGLTKQEIKFSKLIRDADKIDILFQTIHKFQGAEKERMESSKLNKEIKNSFDQKETIDKIRYPQVEYANRLIQSLALIFDINYNSSFKILKNEDYVDRIVNQFKFKDVYTKEAMLDAKNKVNQYILNKLQ